MKKILALTTALIILIVLTNARTLELGELGTSIGDKETVYLNKTIGGYNYSEKYQRTIVDYEIVYKNKTDVQLRCGPSTSEKTFVDHKNGTLCWNVSAVISVVDTKKNGSAIYKYSNPINIKYGGKDYIIEGKGCWICPKEICCLDFTEGFAYNRGDSFKCQTNGTCMIRSGEDNALIIDLKTKKERGVSIKS